MEKDSKKGIRISKLNIFKIAIALTVIVSLIVLFSSKSYATTAYTAPSADAVVEFLDKSLGTIINILVSICKLIVLLVITLLELVVPAMTVDKILFNDLSLINLKFLGSEIATGGGFNGIINLVASASRLFLLAVIAIQFIVLVIIGIKGLLNATSGTGIAEAKKSLVTWAQSLFISLILTFVGFFIIYINEAIVAGLKLGISSGALSNASGIDDVLKKEAWLNWDIKGNIAFFMFLGLRIQAWVLYIYYLRRAFKVLFMLLMSPMVSITMALSSVGAGKSGLSNWLKQFMGTVFIQPVHTIIYLSLVVTLLSSGSAFRNGYIPGLTDLLPYCILIIGSLKFLFRSEKFFNKYFTLTSGAENLGGSAVLAGSIVARGRNYLKKGANVASKAKNVATNVNFNKYQVNTKKYTKTSVPSNTPKAAVSSGTSSTPISTSNTVSARAQLRNKTQSSAPISTAPKTNSVLSNAKNSFQNVALSVSTKTKKTKVYRLASAFKNSKSQAVLDQKSNDKKAKKIFKKKNPASKRAFKGIAKAAGYSLAFVAQNAMTETLIGPQTSKAITDATASSAAKVGKYVASRPMFTKGYIPRFMPKLTKHGLSFKEKRQENVELATERFAKEQIRLADKKAEILGKKLDLHAPDAMDHLDYENRDIMNRQLNGELESEFENARGDFEKELQKLYGLSFAEAKDATDAFIKEIEEGNDYNYQGLTDVQQHLALVLVEMEQAQTIIAFNNIVDHASGIKKTKDASQYRIPDVDLPEYLEDDAYKESPNKKLSHYNDVQGYAPYVLDEVKDEIDKEKPQRGELKALIDKVADDSKVD